MSRILAIFCLVSSLRGKIPVSRSSSYDSARSVLTVSWSETLLRVAALTRIESTTVRLPMTVVSILTVK